MNKDRFALSIIGICLFTGAILITLFCGLFPMQRAVARHPQVSCEVVNQTYSCANLCQLNTTVQYKDTMETYPTVASQDDVLDYIRKYPPGSTTTCSLNLCVVTPSEDCTRFCEPSTTLLTRCWVEWANRPMNEVSKNDFNRETQTKDDFNRRPHQRNQGYECSRQFPT
jgi:hypothetical protein